jgi:hypothetical protein
VLLILVIAFLAACQLFAQTGQPIRPGAVSDPVIPWSTPAVRDLPSVDPASSGFCIEAHRRQDWGIIVPDIDMPPHENPLVQLQQDYLQLRSPGPGTNAFGTPTVNFAGYTSSASPPDDTGDVGPNHYIQGDNSSGGGYVSIYNKTGTLQKAFLMETLGATPCATGLGDPIVQYDQMADRWLITEFNASNYNNLCVYVSKTADPLGAFWAYSFNPVNSAGQDYPKYAVWHDGYYVGVNNGGWVFALDRASMLLGQPATMQEFNIGTLSGFSFQLTMPATLEGDPPPANEPAFFLRPRDTEIHGGTCSGCDLMEMWQLHIDWATPASSALTALTGVQMTDWDHTLCGTGTTWNCMPQPGTTQKIDPIREPIHYPLQYRNFGTHETLVGAFVEDVDGTDHAAVHWFEIRRDTPGSGSWYRMQDGTIGGEANVHRSVASAAMDGSGNIAVGYTRTGTTAPYYPSIYYSGRLSTDALGVMSSYDNLIYNATTSKTNNERWGDYAGIGIDPLDDCTFWFTTEYGGSGATRIASFKFDTCGSSCTAPGAPNLTAATGTCSGVNLAWTAGTETTNAYNIYRLTGACGGAYAKIAGPIVGLAYTDTSAVAGTTYAYVVRGACDASGLTESGNSNCIDAARLTTPAAPTAGNDGPVCVGSTLNLTASTVTSATYAWTGPNGFSSSAQNPSIANATIAASGIYSVTATVGGCTSPAGSTTATVIQAPSAPAAPTFSAISCTTLTVNWGAVSGATSYDVYRQAGGTCAGAIKINGAPVAGTSYPDSGLSQSAQYSYYIVAVNNCGSSSNPNCGTVTTITCSPNIVYSSNGSWAQVAGMGNDDAVVDPGESWGVVVTLTNSGTATGTNVVASLTATGASFCTGTANFGTIGIGGTATATFMLTVDAAFTCGNDLSFNVVNKVSSEGSYANENGAFTKQVGTAGSGTPQTSTTVNFTLPVKATTSKNLAPDFTVAGGSAASASATYTVTANLNKLSSSLLRHVASGNTTPLAKPAGALPATSTVDVTSFYNTNGLGTYQMEWTTANGSAVTLTNISMTVTPFASPVCIAWTGANCIPSIPPEVAPGTSLSTAQTWTDKNTQTWPAASGAQTYNVYYGLLVDLPGLTSTAVDSCQHSLANSANTSDATFTESPTGKAGGFYWYLITATNASGEGTAGPYNMTGTPTPRIVNLKISGCPP